MTTDGRGRGVIDGGAFAYYRSGDGYGDGGPLDGEGDGFLDGARPDGNGSGHGLDGNKGFDGRVDGDERLVIR